MLDWLSGFRPPPNTGTYAAALEVAVYAEAVRLDRGQEPWLLRRSLARHFAHHMEAHVGDNASASNLCFVWWFTEQVAVLFPDAPDTAKFYRKNWVELAAERSSEIWLAASPRVERSALRYVTFSSASPWATGLLALMGGTLEHLDPGEQSEETRKLFHEAVISQMITSLPFPIESPTDPTFSFECAMGETVLKWASHQSEEQRKALEQLVGTSQTLGAVEGRGWNVGILSTLGARETPWPTGEPPRGLSDLL